MNVIDANRVNRVRTYGWIPNLDNDYESHELTRLVIEYNKAADMLEDAQAWFKKLDKELDKLIQKQDSDPDQNQVNV